MRLKDIPVPDVYKQSIDFRFFLTWFSECLSKVKYDTENITSLLDPERCPKNLLWLLCETMGFKYDDRFIPAFNRLILLYFMSMIYNRGSETGIMIAAETNLAQFNLNKYAQEDDALVDRLEDTSIPVNSAYVTAHPDEGYIDIVYFSEEQPIDACIEYVRPVGMYCFQVSGVRADARTKISVDARLADSRSLGMNIGPTHVGHYRKNDYAQLQRMVDSRGREDIQKRYPTYYRNIPYERYPNAFINPGLRTLYSLQMVNSEHVTNSLIPNTASMLGSGNPSVSLSYPKNYIKNATRPMYNEVETQPTAASSGNNVMGTMGGNLSLGSEMSTE